MTSQRAPLQWKHPKRRMRAATSDELREIDDRNRSWYGWLTTVRRRYGAWQVRSQADAVVRAGVAWEIVVLARLNELDHTPDSEIDGRDDGFQPDLAYSAVAQASEDAALCAERVVTTAQSAERQLHAVNSGQTGSPSQPNVRPLHLIDVGSLISAPRPGPLSGVPVAA